MRQPAAPANAETDDPHAHLGASFFQSQQQITTYALKGWTKHRFESAVDILRRHGLIVMQVCVVKNGAFQSKARYWYNVNPSDAERRNWGVTFNKAIDQRSINRRHGKTRNHVFSAHPEAIQTPPSS